MNEPIISPWIFYWIEVIDALKTPLWMMIVMSGAVRVFLQALLMDPDYEPQPREEKRVRWWAKMITMFLVLAIPLNFLLPSKETMYKMVAASYITKENIDVVGDEIDKITDKIIEKINKRDK